MASKTEEYEDSEVDNLVSLVEGDENEERATEGCLKLDDSSKSLDSQEQDSDLEALQKLQESDHDSSASIDSGIVQSPPTITAEQLKEAHGISKLQKNQDTLNFQTEFTELSNKIYEDLRLVQSSLNQDYQFMLEIFEKFWNHRKTMLQEAIQNADELVEIIRKTEEIDSSKRMNLLDHIKACFSGGRWLTKVVNPKAAAHVEEVLPMYVRLNFGVSKVRNLVDNFLRNPESFKQDPTPCRPNCDPFLVTVTCIVDPGEFYVVRWCENEKRERLERTLAKEAATYTIPTELLPGQLYAVYSEETKKWYRGVCGQQCGIYQMGNGLPEQLYSFTFMDEGCQETIRSSQVRCLPEEHAAMPAMALLCTLNQNFKRMPFNGEATARFRQATRRSPMSMKIFGEEGGVLDVDLSQIPCFGEENYYVSIRDALFLDRAVQQAPMFVRTPAPPVRKFKAKYDLENRGRKKGKILRIMISDAYNPSNVYVNILDEEWLLFQEMCQNLQETLADAQPDMPDEVFSGYICAAKCSDKWYRVLVEEPSVGEQLQVIFVDTGYRTKVHRANCLPLADRFLELPAQAVRCVLDGLQAKETQRDNRRDNRRDHKQHGRQKTSWPYGTFSYLKQHNNKKALLLVEYIGGAQVGKMELSKELTIFGIVHIDGEKYSVNQEMCILGYGTTTKRTSIPDIDRAREELIPEEELNAAMGSNPDSNLSSQSPTEENGEVASSETSPQLECPKEDAETHVPLDSPETLQTVEDAPPKETDQNSNPLSASHPSDVSAEEPQVSSQDQFEPQFGSPIQKEGETSVDSVEKSPVLSSDTAANQRAEKPEPQPKESSPLASRSVDATNCVFFPAGMPRSRKNSKSYSRGEPTDSNAPAVPKRTYGQSKTQKTDCPVSILGPRPVEGETCLQLNFVWCKSPDAIYFRTQEMSEILMGLRDKMQEYYSHTEPVSSLLNFEIGSMCVVFCNKHWQRAQITDIHTNSTFEVNLLDCGRQWPVVATNIRRIEPEFEKYPKLVTRVSLSDVYPSSEGWNHEAARFISERLLDAKEIMFFRRRKPDSSDQYLTGVVLCSYEQEAEDESIEKIAAVCLNDELVSEGHASAQPNADLPSLVVTSWKQPINPNVGDRFIATVTCVTDEGNIYLHDVRENGDLQRMSEHFGRVLNKTQPSDAELAAKPGDFCIAKYSRDGKWYRCVVEEVHLDRGTAIVTYVDYMNREEVSLRDIRLKLLYAHVPGKALRCKIYNIKPIGGGSSWDYNALRGIRETLVDKEFSCEVVSLGPVLTVKLECGKKWISKILVQRSLAEYVEIPPKKKKKNKKPKIKNGAR